MLDSKIQASASETVAARRRLARRYRSERRLILYGRLAILLAAIALVALLWSVASRAVHAFTETYLLIELDFGHETLDRADPAATDYEMFLRANLRANFPEARGRTARRQLTGLVSDGASFELRDQILGYQELPAGSRRMRVLASDDADLYLKRQLAETSRTPGQFRVELSALEEGFLLTPAEGGEFETALAPVRAHLASESERIRAKARRQEAGAEAFGRMMAGAKDDKDRETLLEERQRRYARAIELHAGADDLLSRSNSADLSVEADPELPSALIEIAGGILKATRVDRQGMELKAITAPASTGSVSAGEWSYLLSTLPENWRRFSDNQIGWLESLKAAGRTETVFNWRFFTSGNSREAELAGVRGAVVGSFWTMLVTFLISFPIGVFAALYLEEFAPRNRYTDFIEININNLAAVPSIVFGLLGLAAFIQFFGIPRSVPLVGGMVLALMTLPTIIIASRAAIRAVPSSIRDAALGVGASKMQTVFHHVLPLALPGILTGAIIGMAQALGESAPLLLIGMVAFIVGTTGGVLVPASALPIQIFQWAGFPEAAFANRAAAAILVLIVVLIIMNVAAVVLRRHFERRW